MNALIPSDTALAAPAHIGARLRVRRAELELSIEDISKLTHIRPDYLMAIETLNIAALPSIGYVLGFVRSYAKAVGMDGGAAVTAYKADVEIPENLGMRDRPHFVPKRKMRLPRGLIPALGVVGFAVMLSVWYGTQTQTVAASPDGAPAIVIAGETEPAAAIDPDLVTLRTTAPSWVQIKDPSGQTLVSRIFITGETWQAPRRAGYSVSVRDAGAIEIFVGETPVPALGAQGEAVYDVVLGR